MADVPDTKKCQTFINALGKEAQVIRASRDRLLAIRTKWQSVNPATTGTPLDGNLTNVNNAITDLDTLMNRAVWDGMIVGIVPSHEGKALD